jgi:asparagine synthase (glutamine-hydrolysing)
VVLSGDGGDELFAGYLRHIMPEHNSLRTLLGTTIYERFLAFYRLLLSKGAACLKPGHPMTEGIHTLLWFCSPAVVSYFNTVCYTDQHRVRLLFDKDFYAQQILRQEKHAVEAFTETFLKAKDADIINQRLYAEMKSTLVDEMLTKVDRMSMAVGLEARVPFLDHHLVEFALKIPGTMKSGETGGKQILKHAMKPYLAPEILHREKWGFNVPLRQWFQKDLVPFVREYLSDSRIRNRGIFNPEIVEDLLDMHISGKRDNSTILFTLLTWEIWCEQFKA